MAPPLSSADIRIFSPEIGNFCYIKKYRYILHFNVFSESLKVAIKNMVRMLVTSAYLGTLGLLKIIIFKINFMTS